MVCRLLLRMYGRRLHSLLLGELMKNSKKTAFCGLIVALSVVSMLLAYFPYFTYAIPAFAGALMFVICIEIGRTWALGSYIAASIIVMFICEKEAATLFVGFFGFYPIIKGVLEQYVKTPIAWALKFLIFNIAAIFSYLVITFVFGIPFFDGSFSPKIFLGVMLVLGNIVFSLYDIGLTRVISAYIIRLHSRISKLF